jgi:hypothetical protein
MKGDTVMLALAAQRAAVPPHFFAITVSTACVCLALALLLKWKTLNKLNFLIPWLILVAGIGFAAAFLRSWAHSLSSFGAGAIPVIGGALPVIAAVTFLYIVLYDLWPKHQSNTVTEASALLLPAFAPEIGGTIGSFLATALSSVAVAGSHIIGTLFGA